MILIHPGNPAVLHIQVDRVAKNDELNNWRQNQKQPHPGLPQCLVKFLPDDFANSMPHSESWILDFGFFPNRKSKFNRFGFRIVDCGWDGGAAQNPKCQGEGPGEGSGQSFFSPPITSSIKLQGSSQLLFELAGCQQEYDAGKGQQENNLCPQNFKSDSLQKDSLQYSHEITGRHNVSNHPDYHRHILDRIDEA